MRSFYAASTALAVPALASHREQNGEASLRQDRRCWPLVPESFFTHPVWASCRPAPAPQPGDVQQHTHGVMLFSALEIPNLIGARRSTPRKTSYRYLSRLQTHPLNGLAECQPF
jgi:hypothetical protein